MLDQGLRAVTSLQDGLQWSLPFYIHPLVKSLPTVYWVDLFNHYNTVRATLCNCWYSIIKKITHWREASYIVRTFKQPYGEVHVAKNKVSFQQLVPPSQPCESSLKWIFQFQSGLQVVPDMVDILTPTSRKTLSQNHWSKLLPKFLTYRTCVRQLFMIVLSPWVWGMVC